MKVKVHARDIGYDDHGIGLPIIFLHAFPLNRSMWSEVTRSLLDEKLFRLVALDWRGFGESDITSALSTMEDLADDVAGLMDVLGMQQAVLCGLSMGGYVAFAFLRKYPHRVKGLLLADTRPGLDTDEVRANREHVAVLAESQGSGAIADLQAPRLLSDYTRQHIPEVEIRVRRMIDAATPQGIAAASRGMARRQDSSDLLATIPCPTLVVVGEHDVQAPLNLARDYAAKIPGAHFAAIPQAGHLTALEHPTAFFSAVRNFLLSSYASW